MREPGLCAGIQSRAETERTAHPGHSAPQLRARPSLHSAIRARLHRIHLRRLLHRLAAPPHEASRRQTIIGLAMNIAPVAATPQAAPLLLPPAAEFVPAPAAPPVLPAAGSTVTPAPKTAAHILAPSPARASAPATRTAVGAGPFMHRFGPLLLWAFMIAAATGLFRLALRLRWFRPAPVEADWDSAPVMPEGLPESWCRARAVPAAVTQYDRYQEDESHFAHAGVLTTEVVEVAAESLGNESLPEPAAASGIGLGLSLVDYKKRCVAALRRAGWDARTRFSAGLPGPDVIADSGDLVLTLQCHPSVEPVDAAAVKDACATRERQNSNLAAIVSNGPFTEAAWQLAERTGIVLLREDQLASFAA
jgi:hypothetical protein